MPFILALELTSSKGSCKILKISLPQQAESGRKIVSPEKPDHRIDHQLDKEESIEIAIFDTLGNLVATLFSGMQTAGSHPISWNGKDNSGHGLSRGLYPCKRRSGLNTATSRLFRVE